MDNWSPPPADYRFSLVGPQYEISDPRVPERFAEESTSIELKYNLQYNDYTKQKVETSVVVQFINDFPIDFKSGGFVFKMKWKI